MEDVLEDIIGFRITETKRKRKKSKSIRNKARKKRTIFFPAKHRKLSEIISIRSPYEARESVRLIKRLVGRSGFSKKQLRASLILAGARANAMAKKPTLSAKEKRELKQVAKIYFNGAKSL